jgi:hypothetical protein
MSPKPSSRASSSASTSRGFDKDLAELEALKGAPQDAATIEHLRSALAHRNNFIVAKAAKLVAEGEISVLLPEIAAAYNRFFADAVKSDPKCWAKEALANALVKLEHRGKDTYLRGLRHHQMEPSFGPPVDSAGTLRGICAHALVDCPGISDAELLTILVDLFVDTDKAVRIEAARAIGRIGGVSAALALRLRALLGAAKPETEEPEVLGQVFSALLAVEHERAIPLVAASLEEGSDLAAEAAFALSETRSQQALAVLVARLRAGADEWFTGVLLSAIALTRLPEAMDFLVAAIERDARESAQAIEAIGRSAPSAELRARLAEAVRQTGSRRLEQALRQHMPG